MTTLAPIVRTEAPSPLDLLGVWSLERRLVDRRLGVNGTVTGTLTLAADGDAVRWSERGRMNFAGGVHEVWRELRVVRHETDAERWQVCFSDGRPFHDWTLSASLVHPCRADMYRGTIVVDRDGARLRVLWDVTGPAKDQRILTRCRRV